MKTDPDKKAKKFLYNIHDTEISLFFQRRKEKNPAPANPNEASPQPDVPVKKNSQP